MEPWRRWRLGRRKTLSKEKNQRIDLTATGLLMEDLSTGLGCLLASELGLEKSFNDSNSPARPAEGFKANGFKPNMRSLG